MSIIAVSLVLLVALYLLISERISVDLTAVGLVVLLMVTGLLSPAEALAGFSNPAPVTVAALFVVSAGLVRTGALNALGSRLLAVTRGRPYPLLGLSLLLAGVLSAFINNTPVVVLFISVFMGVCAHTPLSPSKFLIPISFVSILAGTATLIGTSTNIIVSDISGTAGQGYIGMFELSVLGAPLALGGALFLFVASFRLMPSHRSAVCELAAGGSHHRYISELMVPAGSPLVGQEPVGSLCVRFPEVELYEVFCARDGQVYDPSSDPVALQPDDVLLVKGTATELTNLLDQRILHLARGEAGGTIATPHDPGSLIVELIVPPHSDLLDRPLLDTDLAQDPRLHFLGVKRRRVHYSWQRLSRLRLAVGDILLVQAPLGAIEALRARDDILVVEDVVRHLYNQRKGPLAMVIFAAMVVSAATGLLDILVAAMTAAFLMLVSGCLRAREAKRSVDLKVVLLIIGTIALGRALEKTGAADLYARGFLALFAGQSPAVVLSAFIGLTALLSHFLSNNSTAVLMVPIAISTAAALGVSPRPFIIGICFGASACYATPIGYQTNLLVYGPGGYSFGDYVKLGMPLNLLVWATASLFIPRIWPF